MTLKGIGPQSAWLFTFEFFAWRKIQNRRQLAALCGFTPTPYQSGDETLDQGISKAGSSLVRAMAIQIAWGWIHFQPDSALTLWFRQRFANGGRRMRAIGIVAVARRLLIELWRFLETGSLPEGAVTSSP
jgi:transposase